MDLEILALAIVSFVIALGLTGWLKQRFGQALLDLPNDRSSHTQPTPRGGGLGFCLAFAITSLLGWGLSYFWPTAVLNLFPNPLYVVLVLLPLAIVGLLDDLFTLSAKVRYAVQLSAAVIAFLSFGAFSLTGLPETLWVAVLMGGVTLIGFTALVNFYNFMDGLDGLVASVTALQLGFLALYLQQPIWWLLVAALLGFLWWNWSPAKIFMGDVGSTVLGASVAIALIVPAADPMNVAALAITLPLTADAIYTLTRRLLKGENIFQAHRTHLYQRLQQSGWNHGRVAIAYGLWTVLLAVLIGEWDGVGSLLGLGISGLIIIVGEYYLTARLKTTSPSQS
ncbi:MAG: glycosyltransferase family 4 protein [Cyanobacteria bacterium P01_E01_bin.43]